jgi:hypothetical protein
MLFHFETRQVFLPHPVYYRTPNFFSLSCIFSYSTQFDMPVATLWLVITLCRRIICPRTFQIFYWSRIVGNQLPSVTVSCCTKSVVLYILLWKPNTRWIIGGRLHDYLMPCFTGIIEAYVLESW